MIKSYIFPKRAKTDIDIFVDALKFPDEEDYCTGFNQQTFSHIPCTLISNQSIFKNIFCKVFKYGIYVWLKNHHYSSYGNCVLKGFIPKGAWYYTSNLGDAIASKVIITDIVKN